MQDSENIIERAPPQHPTSYLVVPLLQADSQREDIVPCAYFNSRGEHVQSKELETTQNSSSVEFRHQQDLPIIVWQWLTTNNQEPDTAVTLFAAVAKTLSDSASMPRLFSSFVVERAFCIDVPVAPQTTRGVVLIFSKLDKGKVDRLIATADPEIRNGSS